MGCKDFLLDVPNLFIFAVSVNENMSWSLCPGLVDWELAAVQGYPLDHLSGQKSLLRLQF